jgi:hypothetical protein
MAEIVGLNSAEVVWRTLEVHIREMVGDMGYGSEIADWVVSDIKQRQFQLQHVTTTSWDSIPAEARPHLAEILRDFKDAYTGIMVSWLKEVVKIECELWVARFAGKDDRPAA